MPQLELTDLNSVKVACSPNDGDVVLVVNQSGRIDLFDISNPARPVKTAEIWAQAEDASFSPDGTEVVSGGTDGTVRLWTLDGKPVAEPFQGHGESIRSVAFSRNGSRIVSGGDDGTVRLWTLDGKPAAEPFEGHGKVRSVAFSPDGSLIVSSGDDGTVRLWTLDGRPATDPFEGHDDWVRSVAFSPDGTRIVSGGDDGTVRLWTLGGKLAADSFGNAFGVRSVAFSPDGTRIVSCGIDGAVRLWTLQGKPAVDPFEGHHASVWSVAFSPEGTHIVSGGDDGSVRLWTLDGKPAVEPFEGGGSIRSVAFSRDGTRIVSGGDDRTVRLWTLDGKPAVEPFQGHGDAVRSVAFSPDGSLIVSGGDDGTVHLWTLEGRPAAEPFEGHGLGVRSVAFSPDGTRIVSGGDDRTVRLWTLDGKPAAEPFEGHSLGVRSVAYSRDGTHVVSGGGDGTVRLWTLDGKLTADPFEGQWGQWMAVQSVAFSPEGTRVVSAGDDGTVRLWTLDGEPAAEPFEGFGTSVLSVSFSPDGTRIVSGHSGGTVRLWALDGKLAAEPIEGNGSRVRSVALSPDGTRIVSGDNGGAVRLWTLDGKPAAELFEGQGIGVQSVAFSPDGTRIVSGADDGTVRLWTVDGKPAAKPIDGQGIEVRSVAFSPDGTRIVSGGGDGTVRMWTLDGNPAAKPFEGRGIGVRSVAFSPDGTRIVSGRDNGTVRLWTLDGNPAADPFEGHHDTVLSVDFSPDGTRIVSGGYDGTVRLWTLDGKQAAEPFEGQGKVWSVAFSPNGKRILVGRSSEILIWNLGTRTVDARALNDQVTAVRYVSDELLLAACGDRVHVLDARLEPRGEILFARDGLVALTSEGVFASTDDLQAGVRAIGEDGTVLTRRGAVPALELRRVRQILFDEFTFRERVAKWIHVRRQEIRTAYEDLGWWQYPFWPLLAWSVVALFVCFVWLVAPHKLAHWAMPVVGSPDLPGWRWLAEVVTLVGFLGSTRRALSAWAREHRGRLTELNFSDRTPVNERIRYCEVGNGVHVADFARRLSSGEPSLFWIEGVGGVGKSSLAYEMLRAVLDDDRRGPIPMLVDEDWGKDLLRHVADSLRVGDRCPTPRMVETMGASGKLCLLIDSLSERGMADAEDQLMALVGKGAFRSVIVTARGAPSPGRVGEKFTRVSVPALSPDRVGDYVAEYVTKDLRPVVRRRIQPLIEGKKELNPLFLRFAIERAAAGEVTASSFIELVLAYLEGLRHDRIDLSADDMVRACRIAAREAVRGGGTPRELDSEYLRGILVREADESPFVDATSAEPVQPAAVLEMLIGSGVLNRNHTNRRIQFAYDPVAEQLAASEPRPKASASRPSGKAR